MAAELTKYLTERGQYGDRKSPLEAAVAAEVVALTKDIAHRIVLEHPDLNKRIEAMVRDLVAAALNEDEALQDGVIRAVAEALAVHARHARMESDDGD